jgi:[acyl-carrier-protein] S-malonyltransferase
MKKYAFIFPGQGAQYLGMGQDIFQEFFKAKEVFAEASEALELNLPQLIFHGSKEHLQQTKFSQIAIFTISMALYAVLQDLYPEIKPYVCAGLSLGEYSALCASDKISLQEGIDLVICRGNYMQQASERHPGTLNVVIGLTEQEVALSLKQLKEKVWIANLNCPGQVVISGTHGALEMAQHALKSQGAKRILPLDVSGPFHSGLMQEAKELLEEKIKKVKIRPSPTRLVMNVSGELVDDTNATARLMAEQVISPTRWEKSIKTIEELTPDLYIELGPGKTLCGMNKKIGVNAPSYGIENKQELYGLEKHFGQVLV